MPRATTVTTESASAGKRSSSESSRDRTSRLNEMKTETSDKSIAKAARILGRLGGRVKSEKKVAAQRKGLAEGQGKWYMSTDDIPSGTNFIVSKLYDGIDYHFRPETFWETPSDPLAAILRSVKGSNRRSMIRDYYAAGKLNELCSELLNDSLDEDTRRSLGRIHPSFIGGEYLPNYQPHEVEIARIELESTTSDVMSLRAKGSQRIKYRWLMNTKRSLVFCSRPRGVHFPCAS